MTSAAEAPEVPRPVDPSPFDLVPDGDVRAAALCLHGLTGTPYEIRPVAEAIAERGVRARGLLLPGHNSTPETLARVTLDDWVTAVDEAYRRLRAEHERIFVVGLSLGGLLALRAAADAEKDVAGVVAIATPLRLAAPIPFVVPLVKHVMSAIPKKEGSDIRDPEARARHPGYREMPLAAVHELIRLQRRLRPRLGEITAPALIAHGAHDKTADPADAQRIHDAIASSHREVLMLPDSGHVVPVDYDGPRLAEHVAGFVAGRLSSDRR